MILRDFTLSLSSSRKISSAQNISKIRFSLAMTLDGAPLQFGTRTGTLHQRHLIWLSHHLCVWICNSICICISFCAHLISLESLRQRHQPIHRPSQISNGKGFIRSAQISSRWRKIQLNELKEKWVEQDFEVFRALRGGALTVVSLGALGSESALIFNYS